MRVHQWVKNGLIFLPVITAHQVATPNVLLKAFFAFIAFSFCASAVYIFNDIVDLEADRHHPTKKNRPLASGRLSVAAAKFVGTCLLVTGLLHAYFISQSVLFFVVLYLVINLVYSFFLKKVIVLDLLVLSSFFTLRIFLGGVATDIPISAWLLAFSMFFFTSLTLIKRVSELSHLTDTQNEKAGRGYTSFDRSLLEIIGITSGQLSLLVFALYINGRDMTNFYSRPGLLWLVLPVLFYWMTRIWIITHRGGLKEDPVAFTLKDGPSYIALGFTLGIVFLAT